MLLHLWLETIISDTWAQDQDISSTYGSFIVKKFLLAEQNPKNEILFKKTAGMTHIMNQNQ